MGIKIACEGDLCENSAIARELLATKRRLERIAKRRGLLPGILIEKSLDSFIGALKGLGAVYEMTSVVEARDRSESAVLSIELRKGVRPSLRLLVELPKRVSTWDEAVWATLLLAYDLRNAVMEKVIESVLERNPLPEWLEPPTWCRAGRSYWIVSTPRPSLVMAGALIVAEVDLGDREEVEEGMIRYIVPPALEVLSRTRIVLAGRRFELLKELAEFVAKVKQILESSPKLLLTILGATGIAVSEEEVRGWRLRLALTRRQFSGRHSLPEVQESLLPLDTAIDVFDRDEGVPLTLYLEKEGERPIAVTFMHLCKNEREGSAEPVKVSRLNTSSYGFSWWALAV